MNTQFTLSCISIFLLCLLMRGAESLGSTRNSIGNNSLASSHLIEQEHSRLQLDDISIVESIILNNERPEDVSNSGLVNLSVVVSQRRQLDSTINNIRRREVLQIATPANFTIDRQPPSTLHVTSESLTIAAQPTGQSLSQQEIEKIQYIKEHILSEVISYELPARQVVMSANLEDITNKAIERMYTINVNTPIAGVSSGDSVTKQGVWIQVDTSLSKQNETNRLDAFKSRVTGFSIGADTAVNEDAVVGLAYNLNNIDTKFSTGSTKEKIGLHAMNFYTATHLTANSDILANFTYGKAFIHTKRDLIYKNKNIESKTSGNLFSVNLGTTYRAELSNNVELLPKINISYNFFRLRSCSENGINISESKRHDLITTPSIAIKSRIVGRSHTIEPSIQYDFSNNIWSKSRGNTFTLIESGEALVVLKTKARKPVHKVTSMLNLTSAHDTHLALSYSYSWSEHYKAKSIILHWRINL